MLRLQNAWALVGVLLVAGCVVSAPRAAGDAVVLPAPLGEALVAVLTAAESCDFQLAKADMEGAGRRAVLVLLDEWRTPQPESAVLVVTVAESPGGSEVEVATRHLADFGRGAPVFQGHGFPSCACCEAAAAGFDQAVFSPSRALAAGQRARACLLQALSQPHAQPAGP